MKSFFRNLSSRFPFFANRPSALERAVRQSPKSRRLRMEPLENRALLAVDAFGGAASLLDSDVGATWGPDPEPAAFSASELSTDAAESTISLAALNALPYGPYVTSEQAALIAFRSNATLADETLADFNALWDEADETTLAETASDGETLSVVAETLTFESLDLGEIEQEPLPGDASVTSGSTGQGDGSGDQGNAVSVGYSGGNTYSGSLATSATYAVLETNGMLMFTISGPIGTTVNISIDAEYASDITPNSYNPTLNSTSGSTIGTALVTFTVANDNRYEGNEIVEIEFLVGENEIASCTVEIIDYPEFISEADPDLTINPNADNTTVNRDEADVGFSVSRDNDDNLPILVPIYTLQSHGHYPRTYLLASTYNDQFTLLNDNQLYYTIQANSSQCGEVDLPLVVRYNADPLFADSMTVHVTWADVDQAKEYLQNKCNEYLAGKNWTGYTCFQATQDLKLALEGFESANLNACRAISSFEVVPLSVAHSNCSLAVSHYAVRVTYCDKTTQMLDIIPDAE